jgi:hypothetical protein
MFCSFLFILTSSDTITLPQFNTRPVSTLPRVQSFVTFFSPNVRSKRISSVFNFVYIEFSSENETYRILKYFSGSCLFYAVSLYLYGGRICKEVVAEYSRCSPGYCLQREECYRKSFMVEVGTEGLPNTSPLHLIYTSLLDQTVEGPVQEPDKPTPWSIVSSATLEMQRALGKPKILCYKNPPLTVSLVQMKPIHTIIHWFQFQYYPPNYVYVILVYLYRYFHQNLYSLIYIYIRATRHVHLTLFHFIFLIIFHEAYTRRGVLFCSFLQPLTIGSDAPVALARPQVTHRRNCLQL